VPAPPSGPTDRPRPLTDHRVVAVLAAYNEAQVISEVVTALCREGVQVVVVDDGSRDGTAREARRVGARVLRHPINRGQGAALQTGIEYALSIGAEVVVTFDADGQHDPADLHHLVTPVVSGECDIALGSRFLDDRSRIAPTRRMVLKLGVLFTRLISRVRVSDTHNGLRAFSRRAARDLTISMDGMAHASEIIDQIRVHGWRFREVPVSVRYTPYSVAKGQRSSNAVRIAHEMLAEKLR
jgi:polyprenyl-phospho-N-acetylgalactosaminyl synthase